jgi:4a-hydroxytetrahydrobiopterin dehydratase
MPLLSDEQVTSGLEDTEWRREGDSIVRDRRFADFGAAIAFVERVAEVAEAANHHPDILVHGWNKVRLTLSTHSEGGITGADLALAEQLDGVG